MYFPIGWPQTLDTLNQHIETILANSDQSLYLFLSDAHFSIWFCKPAIQIVHYQRTVESIDKYGYNISAVWRSDSSQIIIQTTNDFLLFYHVIMNDQDVMPIIEPKKNILTDSNSEENRVPCLFMHHRYALKIEDGISCMMAAEEEIVIATRTGILMGVEWNGEFDDNFRLNISVPDNHHHHSMMTKKSPKMNLPTSSNSNYIIDFKYSTIIGGFALVFSNGLGAFLPLNEQTSTATNNQLQMIGHVDNALCTAINHKYAFIVFGLMSSEAVACDFEEIDRRFVISFRMTLPTNVYPDAEKILGSLVSLQWTPDSTVLATIWENGDFALWSVFGSLLIYSISWYNSLDIRNELKQSPFKVSSLAFGKEGFHLWMVERGKTKDTCNRVCRLSLAKSVLAVNPCSSLHLEAVLLASEDRILIGGNKNSSLIAQNQKFDSFEKSNDSDTLSKQEKNLSNVILSEQESNAVDSFQWITVPFPQSYLDANWPIRLFAIDHQTLQNIAIAGLNGIAMYSLINRRWKLFGNENHEKDVTVTGGLIWYNDYLIAGCYNITDNCFEIRAYSHRKKLDNSNAKILTIENEVQLLSLYHNRLLALCSDGSIYLYDLHLFKRNHNSSATNNRHSHDSFDYDLNISAPIKVILNNLDIFPDCVTLCLLTDLHVDMYNSPLYHIPSIPSSSSATPSTVSESISHRIVRQNSSRTSRSHSILINFCGRVLLLEMDIDTSKLPPFSSDEDEDSDYAENNNNAHNQNGINKIYDSVHANDNNQIIRFKKVVKLASNVENLWLLPHDDIHLQGFIQSSQQIEKIKILSQQQFRPHLETSLYLACGGHGMAIWLSLEHSIRPYGISLMNKNEVPSNNNEHTYISKRIMLSFREIGSAIYPLAIRFREAIVLGAESDFTQPNFSSLSSSHQNDNNSQQLFSVVPYFVVKRTSQVYLHYILRELLRRNLGYRAWEIANTCSTLPHFVHSLELLLHGVLEEEASSSQPIPDALLPRVVDFIRAFPVFLQTVIHCARKTELALWPHLFSIVGSPKDLFQQCILEGQLDTASSYIIVLQNLEKPEVASKCVSKLLQAARVAGCWVTVKELKRFLRATNQSEENQQDTSKSRSNSTSQSSSNYIHQMKSEAMIVPSSAPVISNTNANNGPCLNKSLSENSERTPNTDRPKAMPGKAAISSAYSNQALLDQNPIEENVSINETFDNHENDSLEEINNSEIVTEKVVDDQSCNGDKNKVAIINNNSYDNNIEVLKISTNDGLHHDHCNGTIKNLRAYPGTIMRMTSDSSESNNKNNNTYHKELNSSLKASSLSENNSSTSSILSGSSLTSSTLSVTNNDNHPLQHQNQMINNLHHQSSLNKDDHNHHDYKQHFQHKQLRPLHTVTIGKSNNNKHQDQCKIF